MCYSQDIHITPHHQLLNFDAGERERHVCRRPSCCPVPLPATSKVSVSVSDEDEDEDGRPCPLHSCCRVRREVIVPCSDLGGGRACGDAFAEDVFVPPPAAGREEAIWACGQGKDDDWGGEVFWDCNEEEQKEEEEENEPREPSMDFWPEDEPGKTVRVYLEDDGVVEEARRVEREKEKEKREGAGAGETRESSRGWCWDWRWILGCRWARRLV